MLDVALDGTYAHRGGDKGILDELAMDLGGVEAGKRLLEPVDLLNGRIRERAGGALVRAFWVAPLSERSVGMRASMPPR